MPSAVTQESYRAVPLDPPRKHWSREECDALEAAGLLQDERLELIEGELISKMGKGRLHVIILTFVSDWLRLTFGLPFVNLEATIDVAPEDNPTNEPEPDVIVLERPHWEYRTSNPIPSDVRLLVEVSDTTLGFDLTRKAALYARAGIVEYWVFDVAAKSLIVHRDPKAGRYQSVMQYREQESVAPLAAPNAAFQVADAFYRRQDS